MTEEQIKSFYKLCDSLDIRKYSPVELGMLFAHLKNEVLTGLRRKGEKTVEDYGLAAIDSSIKPISSEQLSKVPSDTQVIYGAYAGTNWVTGLAVKLGKGVYEQKLVTRSFLNKRDRSFSSGAEFAKMVAEQIKEALESLNGNNRVHSLAVSFGFPQIPQKTNYGRDAVLTQEHLTKSWYIKNGKGMPVGKYVLSELAGLGIKYINRVYFANDTTAVALDVSAKFLSEAAKNAVSLPVGFVMGTGDNASAVFNNYKKSNLVNLEIGSATGLGSDLILDRMIKEKLTPTNYPIIEHYMGGDYLLQRLATSLKLLFEHRLTKNDYFPALLKYAAGAKVTSKLASREMVAEDLSELLHLKVNSDDLFILNEVAKRMIAKGGQVAGAMVSVVCDLAGWGNGLLGAIPIEGTVFSQGFGFREYVRKTMRVLIPKNKLVFVPGSGTRGIATEAMIRENG
ncbi:MAG: hypothetical protein M1120_03605 [Patescibacteria group bacterium]|nr:hypothetical protein [Patescibacteria group bacterium]